MSNTTEFDQSNQISRHLIKKQMQVYKRQLDQKHLTTSRSRQGSMSKSISKRTSSGD